MPATRAGLDTGQHPAAAQIRAFEDIWQWDQAAADDHQQAVEVGGQVSQAMQALHTLLESSDMLTSMAIMTPRLKGLRRMLGSTGSPYLRCDSTASHYLKLLMDAVFGPADSWSRQPVEIGIDGEAMVLESPIRFRTLLGALRVRIPLGAPRYTSAAAAPTPGWAGITALLQAAAGRPVAIGA